jgi:hypothetical protein
VRRSFGLPCLSQQQVALLARREGFRSLAQLLGFEC